MKMRTQKICEMLGATLIGSGERIVCEAVNDHRQLPQEGGLFLALVGSRVDGHEYLEDAALAGASAALVMRSTLATYEHLATSMDLLGVDDVESAFWTLAELHRAEYRGPVVAVTGSVGKTTTKNMLGFVLTRLLGAGTFTAGNQNNLLGAPLTVVRLDLGGPFMVLELGSNAPGEIPRLAGLAAAGVAIITGVGAAHLEGFGDLAGVLKEKASLARSLPATGLAIYPSADELLSAEAESWSCRTATFGTNIDDAARVNVKAAGETVAGEITIDGVAHAVELSVPGAFNLSNGAAALLVARELGLDVAAAAEALADFSPEDMRMEWRTVTGMRILVDSYNANPDSMAAVLGTLAEIEAPRKAAVLGSMLELGAESAAWHRRVGALAAAAGLDLVIFVGEYAGDYVQGASSVKGGPRVFGVEDHGSAAACLRRHCRAGDVILLKGSRGARMEAVLESLVEEVG
jgi:UDP-N-acetylmuramoyl-tripeptide--D-alanyl-D-alanine ligase